MTPDGTDRRQFLHWKCILDYVLVIPITTFVAVIVIVVVVLIPFLSSVSVATVVLIVAFHSSDFNRVPTAATLFLVTHFLVTQRSDYRFRLIVTKPERGFCRRGRLVAEAVVGRRRRRG